jgi:hypothetical protein
MYQVSRFLTLAFCVLLAAACAVAQAPAPKPAPELGKLDFLSGKWTSEGEMKPGPMGPGGKITSTDEAQWMDGKFFIVMHTKFGGAMGDGTAISIYGYDPDRKAYTYNEYNSWGEAERALGTVDGDIWTWSSDENFGGQKFKGRFTMKVLSPTTYDYKFEISPDGSNWTLVMDGKAKKQ